MIVDLIDRVEQARKAKGNSPFVGIATGNGAGTIMVRRKVLVGSMRGLEVIDAEVNVVPEIKCPALVLHARGKGVKAKRVFYALNVHSWAARQEIEMWRQAQDKKAERPAVRMSAKDRQLQKLKKQRARLGMLNRPSNPCLVPVDEHEQNSRRYRAESWLAWKQQKDLRRSIQGIALGKWRNTTELYKRVEALGVSVRRWSDLRTHEKERCDGLEGYVKRLWEFCGLQNKPWKDMEEWQWDKGRYRWWLEGLHARKELDSMITALEELP